MPEQPQQQLPGRDFIILPLLALFSAVLLLSGAEFAARAVWQAKEDSTCDLRTPFSGDRYKPNCTDISKIPEGPWVRSKFNECGYRSDAPCGPKPSNAIRLVLLGSSEALGYLVPYPQTFAGLTEANLTQLCRKQVEIQNLAVAGIHLLQETHRIDEALSLQPDAVVLLVGPGTLGLDAAPQWRPEVSAAAAQPLIQKYSWRANFIRVKSLLRQSTAFSMVRYYYLQDDDTYLRLQLKTEQDRTDVLREPLSPAWQTRFAFLDAVLEYLSAKTRAKGIPLILVSSLSRPQAALLDLRTSYPNMDPFAFDRHLGQIASRHEIPIIGVSEDFSRLSNVTKLFYVSDGHMNPGGHEILAQSFTRQLLQSQLLQQVSCPVAPGSDLTAMHR